MTEAADPGDSSAMVSLGDLAYEAGDVGLAEEWYQKAADLGNPVAMTSLGEIRMDYLDDVEGAKLWWQQAAELGNTKAMVLIGDYGHGNAFADEPEDVASIEKIIAEDPSLD